MNINARTGRQLFLILTVDVHDPNVIVAAGPRGERDLPFQGPSDTILPGLLSRAVRDLQFGTCPGLLDQSDVRVGFRLNGD